MSQRTLTITDYGKDYGHGRYVVRQSRDEWTGTNDYSEVLQAVEYFENPQEETEEEPGDPCANCDDDCVGSRCRFRK